MTSKTQELLDEALKLPVEERACLADLLLDSLDPMLPKVEEAWADEVAKRLTEIDAGLAVLIPWEDLRRQLRDEA
jgi:putative addiction module component (TIGR02574 family)